MHPASRRTATAPDGRTLTYVEYGDPDGTPVLHHHGGLLSATDVAPLDGVARRLGVRLIGVDRPGIAGSTSLPDRTTIDGAVETDRMPTSSDATRRDDSRGHAAHV